MARVTGVQEPATLDPYRFPRGAVPVRYDVELAPDLETATFAGRVQIQVDVVEPVGDLVLNAVDLDVLDVRVDGSDVQYHLEPATERLVISPVGGLQPGQVSLVISFTGTLNDKLRGFYRSTYRDDGDERVIATTQMQATDCRRAFPLLGRAGLQGGVRHHARHRPRAASGVERSGGRAPRACRRQDRPCASPTRW